MSDEGWGIVAVSILDVIELVTGVSSWPAAADLITAEAAEPGEPLDPAVGDIGIAVFEEDLPGRGAAQLRRGLYVGALLLVLGVSLFGAYLFWLDKKRRPRRHRS